MQKNTYDTHQLSIISMYCQKDRAEFLDGHNPMTYDYSRALAVTRLNCALLTEYCVLTDKYDKLFDPYGYYGGNYSRIQERAKYDFDYGDWKFSITTPTVFKTYLKFLSSTDTLYLIIAEREHLKYVKPYLEIFQ